MKLSFSHDKDESTSPQEQKHLGGLWKWPTRHDSQQNEVKLVRQPLNSTYFMLLFLLECADQPGIFPKGLWCICIFVPVGTVLKSLRQLFLMLPTQTVEDTPLLRLIQPPKTWIGLWRCFSGHWSGSNIGQPHSSSRDDGAALYWVK